MIEFQLNPDLQQIHWERLSELFETVNWGLRPAEEIKQSFETSSFTYFALDKGKIIGFGRTVDDGKYYALIVDVVIDPDYQGKGIGKQIVTELKDQLKGYKFITLTAAPNKEGFYQRIGWKKQKSAYIFPKDEKQFNEHCEK